MFFRHTVPIYNVTIKSASFSISVSLLLIGYGLTP
nr:MAG TPA: hypothetical protein [Bacteriophage sp.]DAZ14467.1 MAG TPA: hypothetical protein [Caudoviricetes sp.]